MPSMHQANKDCDFTSWNRPGLRATNKIYKGQGVRKPSLLVLGLSDALWIDPPSSLGRGEE